MTREEKSNLLNELLEIEEKNDIGNLTRTERGEFQQWIKALEQEPSKPMIEIDLDYVIKQKYIEREVLGKIRAEIANHCGVNIDYCDSCRFCTDSIEVREILKIIDKYKAESEG